MNLFDIPNSTKLIIQFVDILIQSENYDILFQNLFQILIEKFVSNKKETPIKVFLYCIMNNFKIDFFNHQIQNQVYLLFEKGPELKLLVQKFMIFCAVCYKLPEEQISFFKNIALVNG